MQQLQPGFDVHGYVGAGPQMGGTPMREWSAAAVAQQDGMQGFAAARRSASTAHQRRVNEAARLYADVIEGGVDPVLLREAISPRTDFIVDHLRRTYPGLYMVEGRKLGLRETMSFSDYQALYVDVLDRLYYGTYNAFPIPNKGLVKIKPLRDFRMVKRYMLDGAVTPYTRMDAAAPPPQRALFGPAPQNGAVPANAATSTAAVEYEPFLYQAMTSVNWRAFVNDDLGIFQDLAMRLAIAGNRGIAKFITQQYVDANGPNVNLYKAGYRNLVTTTYGASSNNPPLSAQGVMDALKVLASMRDSTGDPIMITGRLRLWYGPSLMATAQNIVKATQLWLSTEGGSLSTANFPAQTLQVGNWVGDMDLVMDPYIPIVASSAAGSIANTMWGITVDPNSQNRPNSEVGFLQGYETPQIYTKLPNTQRAGGGVDPMLGDFYTMDSDMKVVGVMGGVNIDGRSTVASTGAGA